MRHTVLILFFLITYSIVNAQENADSLRNDYFYFINSNPFNAEIILNDSVLGLTPLRFNSPKMLEGTLLFRKEMFRDNTFKLENYNFLKGITLDLEPVKSNTGKIVFKDKQTQFNSKRNFFIISGLGAAVIGSVMGTIKLKNIANNAYDNYISNYDNSELDKSHKYDIYSTITLVVMQAALAGLMYFLFLDK